MLTRICALATALVMAVAVQTVQAQEVQTLKIGVEGAYPPFSETRPSGEIVGFDIDIAFALCAEIGVTCELVPQAWDGMIPALLEGKFDAIIASMSITEERDKVVDFSDKYYVSPGAFVGPKGTEVDISPEGLAGKVVGTQVATVAACYLDKAYADVVTIKRYDTQENANLDLETGRLDLVFADQLVLVGGFLARPEGQGFETKGKPIYDEECMGKGIGIAVRPDEDVLKYAFSQAIKAIRANGTYQAINEQYFDFDLYGE